jgi:glutamate-ammonia-ligase adenylyltransferase
MTRKKKSTSPHDPLAPAYSRFARTLLEAQPDLKEELVAASKGPWTATAMQQFIGFADGSTPPADQLGRSLRQLRARVMLRIMERDLAGLASLAEVCGVMTALAEVAVDAGLAAIGAELESTLGMPTLQVPVPGSRDFTTSRQNLIVVGMGKLGGGELNVSSDIDLIFLYAEEGDTKGGRALSNHEYFCALGKRLIALLAQPTEDGWVFRVDMRLRPWGDSGPLAMGLDAFEQYLVSHGREWERYAWIKGRPLSGDADDHRLLAALSRPFVFRKYLDYGAIAAMRELHAQIREEVGRREFAEHVKLGPGGIREIEFIAQAFQLIRGGREPELQRRPTLQVLARLAEKQLIDADAVAALSAAYDFLRRTEHRIQYLDDAQTHELPEDENDRLKLARAMNCADWPTFMAELNRHRGRVSQQFELVFATQTYSASGGHGGEAVGRSGHRLASLWRFESDRLDTEHGEAGDDKLRLLEQIGYKDPAAALQRLEGIHRGARYQTLPEQSRRRFDGLVPLIVECACTCGDGEDPDATLARLLDLLETISRRAAYLALLDEHPAALIRLAKLVSASAWTADYLIRHPILLDELLNPQLLADKLDKEDWARIGVTLRQNLAAIDGDAERQMDLIREAHHAQLFRLLARDLNGSLTVEKLADHLSDLADLMLQVTLELCWAHLSRRHLPDGEAPRFAIIGYGKLGGKELGYASDLDMIFIYDDAHDDEHNEAAGVYARLAQRLNVWLTSRTSAGVLFETDLRLRPDGASGLLVTSLDAFREYQHKSAWVWEHQALTRARFCAGHPEVGAAFEAERTAVLRTERKHEELAAEVRFMRQTMRDGHPNRSELFDVKHDVGGMVDIEFIVQYLVLAHAHRHVELTLNHGNIALLGYAARLGLIDAELAAGVQEAYRTFRRIQHGLRLKGDTYSRVPAAEVAAPVEATTRLWQSVLGDA